MVDWQLRNNGTTLFILGSNDPEDWILNFKTRRIKLGPASELRVARWDRYEATVVLRAIRAQRSQIRTVAGHSRGGAIAQIVAYELGLGCECYLFGSKRTGNRQFCAALHVRADVSAYRHRGDWITYLPPWFAEPYTVTLHGRWRLPWVAHLDYGRYIRDL